MSDSTQRPLSNYDQTQIIQKIYNDTDGSLTTGTFLSQEIGNNIQAAYPNSTTEVYSFYENGHFLYALTVVYTDSSKANLSSVTRTA